jgi:hypothetical protein
MRRWLDQFGVRTRIILAIGVGLITMAIIIWL